MGRPASEGPALPVIDEAELRFRTSRSSGPGGQNVNRVESRVTLLFDVAASTALSAEEKRAVRTRLSTRINQEGVLRVASQRHRTQEANRRAAVARLHELLATVLTPVRPRRATAPTRAARRKRLESKRRHAEVKRGRGRVGGGQD